VDGGLSGFGAGLVRLGPGEGLAWRFLCEELDCGEQEQVLLAGVWVSLVQEL
jgi:hypothetical protein